MNIPHLCVLSLVLAACATVTPPQPAPTPPPVATPSSSAIPGPEVITQATCTDDAWLLTHYAVTRLASGSSPAPGTGYPVACCADGVLSERESYRCEIDWPSSDVPGCDVWRDYHATLSVAHPEGARSDRVQANLATLSRWAADGHHCSDDDQAE